MEPAPDPGRPFVLYTLPDGDGYRVALYQWLRREPPPDVERNGDARGKSPRLAPGALWGWRWAASTQAQKALRVLLSDE